MQFEGIRTIPVGHIVFKTLWEVDNSQCMEWASFDAYATADAHRLCYVGDFGGVGDYDALLILLVEGACFLALSFAFFGFAFVRIDDGYSSELICHY
jgi:hypothetical protein